MKQGSRHISKGTQKFTSSALAAVFGASMLMAGAAQVSASAREIDNCADFVASDSACCALWYVQQDHLSSRAVCSASFNTGKIQVARSEKFTKIKSCSLATHSPLSTLFLLLCLCLCLRQPRSSRMFFNINLHE